MQIGNLKEKEFTNIGSSKTITKVFIMEYYGEFYVDGIKNKPLYLDVNAMYVFNQIESSNYGNPVRFYNSDISIDSMVKYFWNNSLVSWSIYNSNMTNPNNSDTLHLYNPYCIIIPTQSIDFLYYSIVDTFSTNYNILFGQPSVESETDVETVTNKPIRNTIVSGYTDRFGALPVQSVNLPSSKIKVIGGDFIANRFIGNGVGLTNIPGEEGTISKITSGNGIKLVEGGNSYVTSEGSIN